MRRYRIRAEWDDDEPMLEGKTVYERSGPRKTGLVDAQGRELVCEDVIGPIGFVHFQKRGP